MLKDNWKKHSLSKYEKYNGAYDEYGRRDGFGNQTWDHNKEQNYSGRFLRDCLHGEGTYQWKSCNGTTVYEGSFYSNAKEGYAQVSFPDGSSFEGLFCNNRAFGPGVMTHCNGRQDAGFWVGKQLVRLSRVVDFIIPRLASSSAGKIKLLQFRRLIPVMESQPDIAVELLISHGCSDNLDQSSRLYSNFIQDPRSLFFNRKYFEKTYFMETTDLFEKFRADSKELEDTPEIRSLADETNLMVSQTVAAKNPCSYNDNEFVMGYKERSHGSLCGECEGLEGEKELGLLGHYFKYRTLHRILEPISKQDQFDRSSNDFRSSRTKSEDISSDSFITHLISWNRSDLCTEMLKQIFRFRSLEEKLTFRISKLMTGARTKFRKTGEKERECIQFLKMCSIGPDYTIKEFLCNDRISEELMDAGGNNSIMFAVAADQHDVLDVLLDHGADINSFNDEGLTPLNLCLLRKLAHVNHICNWETAFLPPSPNFILGKDIKAKEWRVRQSISSLDSIFGDGTSVDESVVHKTVELENFSQKREMLTRRYIHESETEDEDYSSVTVLEFMSDHRTFQQNSTPTITSRIIPKSFKRDEYLRSIEQSHTCDKYLFDVTPAPEQVLRKNENEKKNAQVKFDAQLKEKINGEYQLKSEAINKTVEKLLNRGADPDLSDVPKPALHLAVFLREVPIVKLLLSSRASPDCRLPEREGYLTELHLVALLTPCQELVDICRALLSYGADPDLETSTEFNPNGDREILLDARQGRTPIHLLCMRPDMNYADPEGFLIALGLLLARVSNPNHFFKGHSWLTLAMLRGNIILFDVLLRSKAVDPNQMLGEGLGTALHVLVSTEIQKRTLYDDSFKMCNLLLDSGADVLKVVETEKVVGTCVNFGLREIENEKQKRQQEKGKSNGKTDKKGQITRDHLRDHIKLVDYLAIKTEKAILAAEILRIGRKVKKIATKEQEIGEEEENASKRTSQGEGEESDVTKRPKKISCGEMRNLRQSGKYLEDSEGLEDLNEKIKKEVKITTKIEKSESFRKMIKKQDLKDDKNFTKLKKLKKIKEKKGATRGKRKPVKILATGRPARKESLVFPEGLRLALLELFGKILGLLDVNELLLPYAIFRDGNLYYRFKGKNKCRETYSFI